MPNLYVIAGCNGAGIDLAKSRVLDRVKKGGTISIQRLLKGDTKEDLVNFFGL